MLYAIPAALIIGAALFGCRPEERRLAFVIGAGATLAFVPCVYLAMTTERSVAEGFAYALLVVGCVQWAMLVGRTRKPRGGGGGGSGRDADPEPRGPQPVDWRDFERRFWDEVRRSPKGGAPEPTRSRDKAPV